MGIAQHFRHYIDAFNRQDGETYGRYYTIDVELLTAGGTALRGRQAILDFYARVASGTRRTISVLNVVANANLLAAELESEFVATRSVPDFVSGPMHEGDRLYLNSFVFYDLESGLFKRIRAAAHRREFRPATEALNEALDA